jgi:hypothetical protein
MQQLTRWIVVITLFLAVLQFVGCQGKHDTDHAEHPAKVEAIEGSDLKRVILTEKAIQRIDLKTDEVREETISASTSQRRKIVPYSSLIYDPHGETWIYISPAPRTFMRHKVEVDFIKGDIAVLKDGPAVGTVVVSVAVAELYGAEFDVGH